MSEARGPNPPSAVEEPTWQTYVIDVVSSAGAVVLVGTLLFAVSGVWPPLVAIESQSMTPQIDVGDLVFVMDEDRFPGEGAHGDTGVVTARSGVSTGYTSFDNPGDVIVFTPDGKDGTTPVIHRAMFWVNESEDWYDKADRRFIDADSCEELANCPAEASGFVTKGDHNAGYDQVRGLPSCGRDGCDPVKKSWVIGTAEARVPFLGQLRLQIQKVLAASPEPHRHSSSTRAPISGPA